ncbi:hemerythrin domain-containing protein [Massilia sp. TSP1-1-2]|uniref:hemerythrin domain-containing protein n=1 Tax=Massilia sp. TSP1-1-2 TaxID=2804649 RepID=UPI003CF18DBF
MNAKTVDAISILSADHRELQDLFEQYAALGESAGSKKKHLADDICMALTLHTMVEEEIFYPALRPADKNAADLLDEAAVEHAGAKDLIAQIQDMDPDDDLYDAKVKVLGEQVAHHVTQEEKEMFPKAEKAGLDLEALADDMLARKEEISATL